MTCVEIQNVIQWSTFSAKTKSLAICRFCSTFAVDFAKKMEWGIEGKGLDNSSTLYNIIMYNARQEVRLQDESD